MSDGPYGDGLVVIVDDLLNVRIWLDGECLPSDLRLSSLDQFMRLRKLLEVDDVAVLTTKEANEVEDEIRASGSMA